MESLEFKLSTDLKAVTPKSIDANFAEIESWLSESLKPYENLAVTDESITDAKSIKARINKVSKSINDYKISVKKQYLAPYTAFEDKCKKLIAICDTTSSKIDVQVKEITEARKAEKLKRLKYHFDETVCEMAEFVKWEQIVNDKWGNATYNEDDALQEIDDKLMDIYHDVESIKDLHSQYEVSLLNEYAKSHDLRAVLQLDSTLKARQKAIDEAKAKEVSNDTPKAEKPVEPPKMAHTAATEAKPQKRYKLNFSVIVTMEQANALKKFFVDNKIEYHKIDL